MMPEQSTIVVIIGAAITAGSSWSLSQIRGRTALYTQAICEGKI